MVVTLEPCAVLSGTILDDRGRPGAGARLELWTARGPSVVAEADERGRYQLADIDAPIRFDTVRLTRPDTTAVLRLAPISFTTPGERVVRHVVLPTRVANVRGRVTCDGRPARAVVEWSDGELTGRTVTDDSGRYALDGVTADRGRDDGEPRAPLGRTVLHARSARG